MIGLFGEVPREAVEVPFSGIFTRLVGWLFEFGGLVKCQSFAQ